jgi:hypothetical protein
MEQENVRTNLYSMASGDRTRPQSAVQAQTSRADKNRGTQTRPDTCAGLIDFQDSSSLHDGRFFLAISETLGAIAVDVDSGKLLAIVVVDGHLPVAMLAAAVFTQSAGTRVCCPLLFHVGMNLNSSDYRNFTGRAQVATLRLT